MFYAAIYLLSYARACKHLKRPKQHLSMIIRGSSGASKEHSALKWGNKLILEGSVLFFTPAKTALGPKARGPFWRV